MIRRLDFDGVDLDDRDRLRRGPARIDLCLLHLVRDVHSLRYASEDRVLVRKVPRGSTLRKDNEELTRVRVRSAISHREYTFLVSYSREHVRMELIGERVAENGTTTLSPDLAARCAVTRIRIAGLNDKSRNDTMEENSVVV